MFQLGKDETEYYLLTKDYVSVGEFEGKPILKVAPEGLTAMANAAFRDVSFLLRRAHNEQVAKILSGQRPASPLPRHGNGHHSRRKGTAGLDRLLRRGSPLERRL